MTKRKDVVTAKYVRHPRYGAHSTISGVAVPEADIRRGHWNYVNANFFPDSVLIADISKQNYSIYPRRYYVDLVRECRECERLFIFFAREQRYWFETLRFYVDADCVQCPECRRQSRAIQRRLRRYSDSRSIESPTRKDLMFMVEDALYLLECGVLRDLDSLGKLKNQARKIIPEFKGTETLASALQAAREKEK